MKPIVNEIISQTNLDVYKDILLQIINEVENRGFRLSCRSDSKQSVIEWDNHLIRISVKDGKKRDLKVLWDILHEYGHLIDERPSNNESNIKREKNAWLNAEIYIKSHSILMDNFQDFIRYKDECLSTYTS